MTQPRSLLEFIQIVLHKHRAAEVKAAYNHPEYQEASKYIQGYKWHEPTVGPVQTAVKALLDAALDLDRPKSVMWRGFAFLWLPCSDCYLIEKDFPSERIGTAYTVAEAKELVILHYRALVAAHNITLRELEKPE